MEGKATLIWTPLTTIMTVLGVFGIALVAYASGKAYAITKKVSKAGLEERYTLEKNYYLLSTVVWVVLVSRIFASGLFWVTNESLIPLIPGAMCQFGVSQAGSPYSWIDTGVKLIVMLAYGIWLILDLLNRRVKGSPLLASLSKIFILLIPLLILDTILDLAFYFTVSPVTVPCCRTVFTETSPVPCPYCFVFHDAPMFLVVIVSYGLAVSLVLWGFVVRYYTVRIKEMEGVGNAAMRRLVTVALMFAVIGTVSLIPAILQVLSGGPFLH
ncbi:MAG: hypothetical protein QFX35_04225 [Candidatus Verstraetearchaeota archaeon]|nr:hypothetical protein [Candidatus Verstraetearchaeota archaeon]